jgi:dihydropteroate synthase
MGVLNVTPDSFSDGGMHQSAEDAVSWGERMIADGADIVDVGGESTRPGAAEVSISEETSRVLPVIAHLSQAGVPLSVDTRHAEVATACVAAGASIINDVSGLRDPAMVAVAAQTDAGVVVMHMLGDPETMQQEPHYGDVVEEVHDYLLAQAAALESAGVARQRIALDPGIGFGKTLEHNLELIAATPELAEHGYPVLIGASRKRFIGELAGEPDPSRRLGGSLAVAIEAARLGASIVRVHDVAETTQALAVTGVLWDGAF